MFEIPPPSLPDSLLTEIYDWNTTQIPGILSSTILKLHLFLHLEIVCDYNTQQL